MCGIAGFWALGISRAEAPHRLRAMTDVIRHRGPDGEGTWFDSTSGVAFGHRRLAIVDLSPTGVQPMASASGRYVITFNGEVYNYRALRSRLEREGSAPAWRGSGDTEVMLAAIEAWGLERALGEFIGMFAFALWDGVDRSLTLVRDRLGVKPLFYAQTPSGLAFGSELKSLRQFPGFDARIEPAALAQYVERSCVGGEATIFRGANRVAPGTCVRFSAPHTQAISATYWSAEAVATEGLARPFRGTEDEAVNELETLLRDSVRLRMVSDVPLGAFLSGGVDSSLVVSLMQAQASGPVHTFSIGNENPLFDEAPAARAIAKHLSTHHTELTVTGPDALAVIPKLAGMFDEPFADSSQIPTFLVSQLARRSVTVALSGDGGDELFGGYSRHVWSNPVWSVLRRLPAAVRSGVAGALRVVPPAQWDSVFSRLPRGLPKPRLPGIRIHKLAGALGAADPQSLYASLSRHWSTEVLAQPPARHLGGGATLGHSAGVAEQMMFADLTGYLPDDILTKVDRASMAVSLEAREPLLDHRLVAFAWSLPLAMKVHRFKGKWLLRRLLSRYVPPELIAGPKMGFAVPLGQWLRGPLRDWAEALLDPGRLARDGYFDPAVVGARWKEHLSGTHPWEYHLWDILVFNDWLGALRA